MLRLRAAIDRDAIALGDRDNPRHDLCTCGDERQHHFPRCGLCEGDPMRVCEQFVMVR